VTSSAAAVYLDIDATLIEIHSENKEQTASSYKGGVRFPPCVLKGEWTM
jgi:hypothetical protein